MMSTSLLSNVPRRAVRLALALGALLAAATAQAVPSYARQTGMDCAGCHVGAFGPQLTPAGILFKLGGYTDTDGKDGKVPLSGMAVAMATHTRSAQNPAPEHLKSNDNLTLDEASLFLAGRLADQLGVFSQVTYSGIDHSVALDQADLRWANGDLRLGGRETVVGVSLNNNPTVQDPFNSTPVWSFPYTGPEAGFGTGEAGSLVNGGLEGRVVGASAYAFWDRSLYAELGTYRSLSPTAQARLGLDRDAQRLGGNAYWRLAWFKDLKSQNLSVGLLGWNASLSPDRTGGVPSDHVRDIGLDANYQFLGTREHIATLSASVVRERVRPGDGGDARRLTETRLAGGYSWRNTWGASLGLFNTHGSDAGVGTRGQVLQADWTPWGKEDATAPSPFSWANVRLGAQYWHYDKFDGARAGAGDHDTFNLFLWTAF